MLELPKNKKILVIAAHPDDELLGLGGTINKLVNKNNCIARAIILGEGITSRSETRDTKKWQQELEIHKSNLNKATEIIGYSTIQTHNFPDNRFDTVPLLDIIKKVEDEIDTFQPDLVFTHHGGDLNIDHQKTFESVIVACRPVENQTVSGIITFETPSSTEWQAPNHPVPFIPNLFVVVSEENLNAKIEAMESYQFEKRKYPHPRSPEALKILAQKRGIEVGNNYAEAFCLVRGIN